MLTLTELLPLTQGALAEGQAALGVRKDASTQSRVDPVHADHPGGGDCALQSRAKRAPISAVCAWVQITVLSLFYEEMRNGSAQNTRSARHWRRPRSFPIDTFFLYFENSFRSLRTRNLTSFPRPAGDSEQAAGRWDRRAEGRRLSAVPSTRAP